MTDTQRDGRRRVAIIGGGVAGLFSALALSDPRLGDRFDITVYSRGWRLGGKCASGRNARRHERIEEHGLHLWFGFYENSLGWTRRVLESLPAEDRARYHRFEDAFVGIDDVVLYEEWPDHTDPRSVSALRLRFPVTEQPAEPGPLDFGTTVRRIADVLALTALAMVAGVGRFGLARLGAKAVGVGARLGVRLVPRHLGAVPGARPGVIARLRLRLLLGLLRLTRRIALRLLQPESGKGEGRRRQLFAGLDLLTAALSGIIDDRLLEVGFGTIDGLELRQWLAMHGARPSSLNSGSVLWALYDLVFGYHRGDSGVPELAAGRAMLALLRMLGGYHGHFGYRMASSMGEVAIAPMYDLLRRRGVHFAFFRDLRAVHLDDDGALTSVELHRQADVEVDGYDPFAWTGPDGGRYWPIEPDWATIGLDPTKVSADALENGLPVTPDEVRHTLRLGVDVDEVILAVPAPVLSDPALHEELVRVPEWRRMIDHSASVATIAYQVWSDESGSIPVELNDRYGNAIVSSYDQPFSTYCPMDQLAAVERWNGPRPVRIGYGCGVWPEPASARLDLLRDDGARADPRAALSAVQREAASSLDRLRLLPDPPGRGVIARLRNRKAPAVAPPPRTLDGPAAAFLHTPQAEPPGGDASSSASEAPSGPEGEHHTLWVRLNDAPAHRYVTTPPANPWFRIDPDDTGVAHLWAAGDWTANLIDGGCVEATVISALLAARGVARAADIAEQTIAECLPIVGEGTWLYHGGRGGPPPSSGDVAWSSPARVGALTAVPGPYASDKTTLYAWLAEIDPERAAAVAQRCFADMTDGAVTVEPVGSLAMITAGDIGAVSSLSPAYRRLGRLGEKQVVVWLPCHVRWGAEAARTTPPPPPFALFVPYIWVDNPMSLTTGREGLGWPKAMADFDPAEGIGVPLHLSVYGLEHYSPDTPARGGLPLLSIVAPEGGSAVAEEVVSLVELSARLAAAALESFGTDAADAVTALARAVSSRGLPQLFAKSMIAADDDARADFASVVTAAATVLSWRDATLLGPCELVVHDVASHPVRRDLGLQSQTLPIGFRIELDFRQESGQLRWSSWASPGQRRDRRRLLSPRGRRR